jgi:DUF4097 and DUF4098 domain-containing protein YvlB
MPTFATPSAISASIQVVSGDVLIEATERDDTTVDITPSNAAWDADVAAAEQTRVEFADGHLRVIGAKGRSVGLLRKPGSIRVVVHLPRDSRIEATTGLGYVHANGRVGDCRIRTGAGDVALIDAGSVNLVTGLGTISAEHVTGDATCATGSGGVRIAQVDGSARVRNSNGETWIGGIRKGATVKSSNGGITIGRIESGTVDLKTALGRIEVGVRSGTAARLDLHTSFGSVVTELDETEGPKADERSVSLSAHTSAGDIVVARAADPTE